MAQLARLEKVVERQPQGWNEILGPHARLSSGEQQRVALARALLMRPRVLILDECLSALDFHAERMILGELKQLPRSTTIIFISHRESLYDWADRMVMIRSGRLLLGA